MKHKGKNYIQRVNSRKLGFRKFILKNLDKDESSILFTKNSEFIVEVPNQDIYNALHTIIPHMQELVFTDNRKLKEVLIELDTNAELIIYVLEEILKYKKMNKISFNFILTDKCKNIIEKSDFFVKNKNEFLIKSEFESEKQSNSKMLNVLENIAMSQEISEEELKIYVYLFGNYITTKTDKFNPSLDYDAITEDLCAPLKCDKEKIYENVKRLKKRKLIDIFPPDKNSSFQLFQMNYDNPINFGIEK